MAKPNMIYPSQVARRKRALAQQPLCRWHRVAFQAIQPARLGRALRQTQNATDGLRRLDQERLSCRKLAHRFPSAAGAVRAQSGKLWHRHPAGRARGDGSQSFQRISGRDADHRRANRQAARLAEQRLSRCHQAAESKISSSATASFPSTKDRLKVIEGIIVKQNLVSLPERPARIRIGTPAESAQQPAPHMVPPPLLNNTGQQGEFVLPLNMPAGAGIGKGRESRRLHLRRRLRGR